MSKQSKSKATTPPTILEFTIHANRDATLLARRGTFAHLAAFTFTTMNDLVIAVQTGAAQLDALEKNPPPIESGTVVAPAPATELPVEEQPPDADGDVQESAADEAPEEDAEALLTVDLAAPADYPVFALPGVGVTDPAAQPQLF